jgi:hypothetical protein
MTDDLSPTQYLVMEVLAARARCGEPLWTFPSVLRYQLDALLSAGLIDVLNSPAPGSLRAKLTDAGRKHVLKANYVPPIVEVYDTAFDQIDRHLDEYRGAKALREGVQAAVDGARVRLETLR